MAICFFLLASVKSLPNTAILPALYFFSASSILSSNTSFELDDDIGLRRPQLSKELQEVYDTLMNFQKRDSAEESFVAVKPQVAQPRDEEDESDRLSDILAAYGGGKRQEIQESYHQHVHLATDLPKAERKNEYFIPVDYDTYQAWLHQKKDFDHVAHIRNAVNVIPKATKRITKPIVALHDEADPGDDTSQDAADLISQESKEDKQLEHLEPAVKVIAHPDRVNQSPNSASLKKTIENRDSDIETRKKSISPMLEETHVL